jgi:ribose transport system permease protein
MSSEQPLTTVAAIAEPAALEAPPAVDSRRSPGELAFEYGTRYAAVVVLLALIIVATVVNGRFWQSANLTNILAQNAPIALVSIGMTFVIISGMFDLSVGALYATGGVVYASLDGKMPLELAALVTIAVGVVAGLINGTIITALKVNPFIATIGTAAAFTGGELLYSNSNPIQVEDPHFQSLGLDRVAGLPWPVIIAAGVFLIASFLLGRTIYGRYVHAVGGNREAARLVGIRVDLIHLSVFVVVAVCSVLAGLIVASELSVGQPTLGANIGLDSFAIVVIGGTSVWGGEGAVWRTIVGVLILGVLSNIFDALAWPSARQEVVTGCVLVAAVAIDALRHRRS